ncbi:MAG: hypothetical protein HUJ96_07440 [Marinilabiliaceae bacterium]|nr:hypothetical protein [Marinilabiliaceae bacterium]
MRHIHNVSLPKDGDFIVDGKYTFEVGGRNKKFSQIADLKNSYLAVDIEMGRGIRFHCGCLGYCIEMDGWLEGVIGG